MCTFFLCLKNWLLVARVSRWCCPLIVVIRGKCAEASPSVMVAVRVSEETLARLERLVKSGRATSLGDAVTYLFRRVEELEVLVAELQGGEDVGGKRERVSAGADERARRDAVSEVQLSSLWINMLKMKQAAPRDLDRAELHAALGSSHFPEQWGALLLQTPEAASRDHLSRLDVSHFLADGWSVSRSLWEETCAKEFDVLDKVFEEWTASEEAVETLVPLLEASCPTLAGLFCLIAFGSRAEENKKKDLGFKTQIFVFLLAALGKVRSQLNSACGTFLFRLWRSLGASVALNDCLAAFGLSIASKPGREKEKLLIGKVSRQIQHHTRMRGSSEIFFASCDNLDETFKSRLQQIGSRDESKHFINSTLYMFDFPVPRNLSRDRIREDTLDISVLFPSAKMNDAIAARCEDNLGRTLLPLLYGFVFEDKPLTFRAKAKAPKLVSLGKLQKTKTFPLPTENLSESRMHEFYQYEKIFLGRFPDGEKVLVAADAKTYLLMKKSQKLRKLELRENIDCDDSKAIPVPDLFHLGINVFLGECTRSNFALLQQFCSLIGGSYVINAKAGKCMNDTMRVFNAFYPVAVARLFQYFLTNEVRKLGVNPPSMEYMALVREFWLWIIFTTRTMSTSGRPVLEFERHCRLVLILAVYNVMWESARCADHDALMDVMHWILPIVCQGPFSQYRSVVIDSLAYYHRASEVERFLYKQSFTVNPTGRAYGGTPTGQAQEYNNKESKEFWRRDPTHAETAGAATALIQHDRDVKERLGTLLPLKDQSEGVAEPPEPRVVLALAKMVHWMQLGQPVPAGKDATLQKPLFGLVQNEDVIRKVIRRVGRAAQFTEMDVDGGSASESESAESE
jgi:hypothetical protein